jgi:hypothetical protein
MLPARQSERHVAVQLCLGSAMDYLIRGREAVMTPYHTHQILRPGNLTQGQQRSMRLLAAREWLHIEMLRSGPATWVWLWNYQPV